MGDHSKIEWTDATWNPTRGCSRVSAGCQGCYAERVAMRFSGPGQPYEGLVKMVNGHPTWTGKMLLAENMLTLPLNWKKGRMVFVDSMSDLFHAGVPFEYVDKVFAMMAMCPQHRFQVLTKRPDRMLEYVTSRNAQMIHEAAKGELGYHHPKRRAVNDWPLRNVWLGVSAENQSAANERIPLLLATPATVRWVSAEPLLGAINFTRLRPSDVTWLDCLEGREHDGPSTTSGGTKLDWVVAGGESGSDARPMHQDWVRNLRDQCAAAGVPFLFKQWGEWRPPLEGEEFSTAMGRAQRVPAFIVCRSAGTVHCFEGDHIVHGEAMLRIGKKAAGRLLDGVEHNGYPRSST